jgi:hypothetical protein
VLLETRVVLFEAVEDLPNLPLLLLLSLRTLCYPEALFSHQADQGFHLADQGLDLAIHVLEAGGGGLAMTLEGFGQPFQR